jgi:hypothetical protein
MAQFQRVISLNSAPQVRIPAECRKSLGSKGVVLRSGFEPTTFAVRGRCPNRQLYWWSAPFAKTGH